MPAFSPVTLAVQAGGSSQRMGQDKALLRFAGEPLIQRIIERGRALTGDILVTTNTPNAYRFLGVPLYGDLFPGLGALGGLHTALAAAQAPVVAVVGCDMPFINPDLLAYQAGLLAAQDVDVVIPCTAAGLEPLHCVYRRQPCLDAVRRVLEAGQPRRLIAWFPAVRVLELGPEAIAPFEPDLHAFINVNTPEEFAQAERLV